MTDSESALARTLWERLSDPREAGALVGLGFDLVLDQPVGRFVTPERVLDGIDRALAPAHLARVLFHVQGFTRRDPERAKTRNDRLEDYLTDEARQVLRELLSRPVELDRAFLEALVRQDAVRHLLRSVVQETVTRFAQALKPGKDNGLLSQLPRGPGMGLLTKMASQMEGQVQRAATHFVSSSIEVLLGRLAHILGTPETAAQLGRLRAQGFDALMPVSTRALWKLAHRLPLKELLALVPALVSYNLGRPELRETIRAETAAILETETAATLRDLLDPAVVAVWREQAVEMGAPLLSELRRSEALRQWLVGRVLPAD